MFSHSRSPFHATNMSVDTEEEHSLLMSVTSRSPSVFSGDAAAAINMATLSLSSSSSAAPPAARVVMEASSAANNITTSPPILRGTISVSASPMPCVADDEEVGDATGIVIIPAIDTLLLGRRTNESTEPSSETTHSNQSPVAINPLRSMNPAFSLSPRTASSSGILRVTSNTPSVTLTTDRDKHPTEHSYALGTVEGRRNFVTDSLCLGKRMSTRSIVEELIPALLIAASYDDSIYSIAELLPGVVKLVEGLDDKVFVYFLGLIMDLCSSADHGVVRQIAASLEEIVLYVGDDIAQSLLLPLIMSMRESFWSSPRAVAAALLGTWASQPSLVQESGIAVKEWFNYFVELSRDKCQFVQEMAVSSLHVWVTVAEAYQVNIVEMPLPLVHECLAEEKSDAVRHTLVAEMVRLAEGIGKEATRKYLQLPFTEACKDTSWRVRYIAAKNLGKFARCCPHPGELIDAFVELCADEEKETRAVAVEQLGIFLNLVSQEVLVKMCMVAVDLAKDRESTVRESVANVFYVLLSPSIVGSYTPEQQQVLFSLLTDDNYSVGRSAMRSLKIVATNLAKYLRPDVSNNNSNKPARAVSLESGTTSQRRKCSGTRASSTRSPSVRSSTGVPPPASFMSVNEKERQCATIAFSGLLDYLHLVSDSKNWRVREAVVISLRYLSATLTEGEFLPFVYIIRSLLRDAVSVVRARAAETLSIVAVSYGPEWAALMTCDLLQSEFGFDRGPSPYTWRMVAIQTLSGLLPVVSELSPLDLRRQELLQQWARLVQSFSQDSVSNVRLAMARSLAAHWEWYVASDIQREVVWECVERLRRDGDKEVAQAAAGLTLKTTQNNCKPL